MIAPSDREPRRNITVSPSDVEGHVVTTQPGEDDVAADAIRPVSRVALIATVIAAFGTYFCVYGFRKPFTVGSYIESQWFGIGFKEWLLMSQVLGYMLSKFIGIKVIAEMPPRGRARGIIGLVGVAFAALIAFGLIPRPYNMACLFVNGLALGMTFGLVLGFLEGRRATEALAAGLCTSFILADGATKSVGAWLLARGISETWMPAAAGAIFMLPLLISVAVLAKSPPPDQQDQLARSVRPIMDRRERRALFGRYAFGLTVLVAVYLVTTILRSLRADFMPELWLGLGLDAPPSAYTRSEFWVAAGVLAFNGGAIFILDNRRAFFTSLWTCFAGFVLLAFALLALRGAVVSPFVFMVLIGLGLYLPYVAIHTTVFERLLAMTRERGNLGFLMYVADAFGYLGYVGVMITRNLMQRGDGANERDLLTRGENLLDFYLLSSWLAVGVCGGGLIAAIVYFSARTRPASDRDQALPDGS
jgi:hypothetical protein